MNRLDDAVTTTLNQNMKLRGSSLSKGAWIVALLALAAATSTHAANATGACPYPHALGTARTLAVSAADTPRVGLKEFPTTLPLADKEVVLTFDDGPFAPTTRRVLKALADECVRATFFVIGQNAVHEPDLLRKLAADGHTIGTHTWSHKILGRIAERAAQDEIDRGMAAVDNVIGKPQQPTRFFRFPGFVSTPQLLQSLNDRGVVVFGADLWASDWNKMSPDQQLHLIEGRLKAARKGIILFHDIKAQTASMLPAFLQYLKDQGYRVVDVVPADGPTRPSAAPTSAK